jgi:hypothetical protein
MRSLALLFVSFPALAVAPELSDIDVESITKLTAEFLHASPSWISPGSTFCTYTAEDGCTLEVHVDAGGNILTVSKIDGVWAVGRWQREIIAYRRCTTALLNKWGEEEAAGVPRDLTKRREDARACYGPSGRAGGMREGPPK